MKKINSIMLASAIFASILTGCENSNGNENTVTSAVSESSTVQTEEITTLLETEETTTAVTEDLSKIPADMPDEVNQPWSNRIDSNGIAVKQGDFVYYINSDSNLIKESLSDGNKYEMIEGVASFQLEGIDIYVLKRGKGIVKYTETKEIVGNKVTCMEENLVSNRQAQNLFINTEHLIYSDREQTYICSKNGEIEKTVPIISVTFADDEYIYYYDGTEEKSCKIYRYSIESDTSENMNEVYDLSGYINIGSAAYDSIGITIAENMIYMSYSGIDVPNAGNGNLAGMTEVLGIGMFDPDNNQFSQLQIETVDRDISPYCVNNVVIGADDENIYYIKMYMSKDLGYTMSNYDICYRAKNNGEEKMVISLKKEDYPILDSVFDNSLSVIDGYIYYGFIDNQTYRIPISGGAPEKI